MLKSMRTLVMIVTVVCMSRAAVADPAGHTLLSTEAASRATGYEEANKIITVGDRTHVAWLDSTQAEGFTVRIRTLDRKRGHWSPTYAVGGAVDNHGGPALTVDSRGYLHIVYGPHHHPMRYRRSLRPNDASEWTAEEQVGAGTTYPTLVCAADDTLIMTCRSQRRNQPWVIELYTKPRDGKWQGPRELFRGQIPGYAHFQEALAWSPDHRRLHMVYRLLHGTNPGNGIQIGYLYSDDAGQTWRRTGGDVVELPATMKTTSEIASDIRAPEPGRLHNGALAVAPDGTPYTLVIKVDTATGSEIDLAWLDGDNRWQRKPLTPLLPRLEDGGAGYIRKGGFTINEAGEFFLAVTQAPFETRGGVTAPHFGHPRSEVLLLHSGDGGKHFTARPLSPLDPTTPHWLPNLERPTGHNRVPTTPGAIYTAGIRGETNKSIVSNRVWWVDLDRLPSKK